MKYCQTFFFFLMQAPVTAHCLLRNSKNKESLKDRNGRKQFHKYGGLKSEAEP